jgi:alanine or glycine:cation symporter, AGCS family
MFMELMIKSCVEGFNHAFALFVVFPLMIAVGVYLTIKLRFVQISKIKLGFSYLLKKDETSQGNISHFEAIATVLAGNFGTGNISGMAVALSTGGPGALVWMWIMAFVGAAIQYASCMLGVKYRTKNTEGEYVGGPMYYLRDGLGYRKMGAVFAVLTLFGALTVGNFAQINSVTLPLEQLGLSPFYCSLGIAAFVGLVILGGIKRLAKFASFVIPFKALLYLGTAFIIIAMHADRVLPSLQMMFRSAFDFSFSSIAGGILGITALKAISTGFDRGLFATDAGTGIVPILQASARSTNPVIDGIVTLVAPLMVMIVCTTTGLVLMVTGVWEDLTLRSTNMVTTAFSNGLSSPIGTYVVVISLVLFAYTTILAWAYCGEKALGYLYGNKIARLFRYIYIGMIPIGSLLHVDLVWALADAAISLMLVINLVGIMRLSGEVIDETQEFDFRALPA